MGLTPIPAPTQGKDSPGASPALCFSPLYGAQPPVCRARGPPILRTCLLSGHSGIFFFKFFASSALLICTPCHQALFALCSVHKETASQASSELASPSITGQAALFAVS